MWPGLLFTICVVVPKAGCHAMMLPVIESKMKRAGAAMPPGGVTLKSLVALATAPVGNPPPMVMVWGLGFRANGLPETSPRNNCVVLVPLFATQNGLVAVSATPHGLTRKGS